jgi:hypothetical protein
MKTHCMKIVVAALGLRSYLTYGKKFYADIYLSLKRSSSSEAVTNSDIHLSRVVKLQLRYPPH